MMASISIATCPINPTSLTPILAISMRSPSCNNPKSCMYVFVPVIKNATAAVLVTWPRMTPVCLASAVASVLSTRVVCYKQSENCKNKVS